jgi:hypothetical protein
MRHIVISEYATLQEKALYVKHFIIGMAKCFNLKHDLNGSVKETKY